MQLENMQVANEEISLTDDQWEQLRTYSCFTHKDACEEILALYEEPTHLEYLYHVLNEQLPEVVETMRQAQKQGYRYICFYA